MTTPLSARYIGRMRWLESHMTTCPPRMYLMHAGKPLPLGSRDHAPFLLSVSSTGGPSQSGGGAHLRSRGGLLSTPARPPHSSLGQLSASSAWRQTAPHGRAPATAQRVSAQPCRAKAHEQDQLARGLPAPSLPDDLDPFPHHRLPARQLPAL